MTNPQTLNICILQPHPCQPNESPIAATEKVIRLLEAAVEHCQNPATKESEDPVEASLRPVGVEAPGLQRDNKTIDLVLLPELCPFGRSAGEYANKNPGNEALHQEIECRLRCAAKRFGCAICYGAAGWTGPEGNSDKSSGNNFVRRVVIDSAGGILYSSHGESPVCFCLPKIGPGGVNWKFGLLTPPDVGELGFIREMMQNFGVHAIFQPTSLLEWDTPYLAAWRSFKENWAVNYGVYFLASNYAGEGSGGSSLSPPLQQHRHRTTVLGCRESYLLATLAPAVPRPRSKTESSTLRRRMQWLACRAAPTWKQKKMARDGAKPQRRAAMWGSLKP